jgi:hypothetical protein
MNWIQVFTIIGVNFGLTLTLFLWLRKETNADRREISSSMTEFKKMWAQESKEFYGKWAEESKEFHGRLCMIEERRSR